MSLEAWVPNWLLHHCLGLWAKGWDMEFNRSIKFFNVFFTINSKSHEIWTILSASILAFSCGSNGMGPDI